MGNLKLLVDRIGSNHGSKEIVVILAIKERGEIGGAIFTNNGEREAALAPRCRKKRMRRKRCVCRIDFR